MGRGAGHRNFKPVRKKKRLYFLSMWGGLRHAKFFGGVQNFCIFIGYPRSGHTLIGSLLDAHPNAIVADELNVLRYIEDGFSNRQLFYLLLRNSRRAAAAGRTRSGYCYDVPGQWQGHSQKLLVIGDKMGHASARALAREPSLLDSVRRLLGVQIKFIHVVRNPYDVIATNSLRSNQPLTQSIEAFFGLCDSVERVKHQVDPADIYEIWHEDFIANPKGMLKSLCNFFSLKSNSAYLESCARIVFSAPRKSRLEVPWSNELIETVGQKLQRFAFLRNYSYKE
jgi:hypothetical protein